MIYGYCSNDVKFDLFRLAKNKLEIRNFDY